MADNATSASSLPQPTIASISKALVNELLEGIIHDTVLWQHRAHKTLLQTLDPVTKLPLCDRCNLPRLLDPPLAPRVRGAASDPPKDTQYCEHKPWSKRPGHDIYDNPFPKSDASSRPPTKKEREAAAKNKNNKDDTPASEEANGTAPPSPSAENSQQNGGSVEKGDKKASKIDEKLKKGEYIPWHTCPSCKRSLLITRFAKHLEGCMGLSGRAASRNAMAKMNGSTPSGSRGATPNPSQENGDEEDEDVKGAGGVRKKLLKKNLSSKIKKTDKSNGVKLKLSTGAGSAKRPPSTARASPAPSSTEKRDRDEMLLGDDGDEDDIAVPPPKKKMKLQRVGSAASVQTMGTAAPMSAVDMERGDSNDGSFVDDGSIIDE